MLKKKFYLFLNFVLICLIVASIMYFYNMQVKFKQRARYEKKEEVLNISEIKVINRGTDNSDPTSE